MAEEIERGASVPWLTIKQAADELGVKEHVLRDAGRREELVLGKAGRTSMVQRSALEKWLLSSPAPKAPRLVKADDTKAEARVAILNAARRAG